MGKVNYYSTEEIKINSKQISLPFLKICLLYFSNIIEQAYTIVITNEYNMISLLESPNFITVESPLIINLVFKRMSKIITLFYCSLRSYLSTEHTFETTLYKHAFYFVRSVFLYKPHLLKPQIKTHFY